MKEVTRILYVGSWKTRDFGFLIANCFNSLIRSVPERSVHRPESAQSRPRHLQRHSVAPAGPRRLRRQPVRHARGRRAAGPASSEPRPPPLRLLRRLGRQAVPAGRLADAAAQGGDGDLREDGHAVPRVLVLAVEGPAGGDGRKLPEVTQLEYSSCL